LPCKVVEEAKTINEDKQLSGGRRLQWGDKADEDAELKFIRSLDLTEVFPMFVEGLREKQEPLNFIAD